MTINIKSRLTVATGKCNRRLLVLEIDIGVNAQRRSKVSVTTIMEQVPIMKLRGRITAKSYYELHRKISHRHKRQFTGYQESKFEKFKFQLNFHPSLK